MKPGCFPPAQSNRAAVDDEPGDGRAVAAEVLGGRVDDDVGAELERPDEVRRRDGVVDDQRDAVAVRDRGDGLDVEDVALRVADGLAEERLGVVLHQRLPGLRVVRVLDEGDRDAELGQRVVQQVVGAAVQRGGGDDVVAGLGEVQDRQRRRGLPAGHRERRDAALERGDALLERVLRRVHDPRVDVAELGQREEVGGVLGVAELVRGRRVDRQRAGAGGRVGAGAGVDLPGLEAPALGVAHAPFLSLAETRGAQELRPCRATGVVQPALPLGAPQTE